jgi:hypothetical protein
LSWIQNVIAQQDGRQPAPTLEAADAVNGPFMAVTNATVDSSAKTITLPAPATPQFYRLNGCVNLLSISGVGLSRGVLELTWTTGN